jgi:hypothetical protein
VLNLTENRKYVDEHYSELCLDRINIDQPCERAEIVYYNPDSGDSGQLVYNEISFDILREAFEMRLPEPEFWDYIESEASQTLLDITSPDFLGEARRFIEVTCDHKGRDSDAMEFLRTAVLDGLNEDIRIEASPVMTMWQH